jgi:GH25 family lysozyme M1 (1,4-beta-N-acetylmuramidase)
VPNPCLNSRPKSNWSRLALKRTAAAAVLVAAVTATSAGVANAGVIGPDVSSYNHDNGATLDWGAMHQWGQTSFAFIKATEGGGYRNPQFSADYAAAISANVVRGAYHFARPSGGSPAEIASNATAESNQFTTALGSLDGPGNLPPVLDLEDAGSLNSDQLVLWVHTWLDQTAKATGRTPIIYTNPSFWTGNMANSTAFAGYPLWLATYGVASPPVIGGWPGYTFWQYTDVGQIPGSSLPVDVSVFNGTYAQLQAMTMTQLQKVEAANQAWAAVQAANRAWLAAHKSKQDGAAGDAAKAAGLRALAAATLSYTTQTPYDSSRAGQTTSRSSVRSWLHVLGMDGSSAMAGS